MTFNWENQNFIYLQPNPNNGSPLQVVCINLLEKQTGDAANYNGCRTYQMHVDLTIDGSFTLPNMFQQFAQGVLSQTFFEKVICKDIIEPISQIHHYRDTVPVIEVPCAEGLVGAEYWLSKDGTNLIQGPPPVPPGVSGLPQSNYWKCSYTVVDPNAGPLFYEGIDLEKRFILSDSAWQAWGKPHLLWVNYVDRFGKRSQRVPIVLVRHKVDNYAVSQQRLKKSGPGFTFQFADTAVVLNQLNHFIDSINPLISGFGQVSYIYWEHYWRSLSNNTGFVSWGNTNLQFANLPDSAVSQERYREEIHMFFSSKIFSPCDGQTMISSTLNLPYHIGEINFEKAIYPPKPNIFLLRNNVDSANVCLTEVTANDQYIWEYYTSPTSKILDSTLHGKCHNRAWKSFYQANANQYLTDALRYDVRAMSIWRGDTVYSEPVPVLIVFDLNPTSPEIVNQPLYKPQTANEDEIYDYCFNSNPEPGTYHDLTYDETAYTDSMDLKLNQIQLSLPSVELSSQVNKFWDNSNNYYYISFGVPRVCYGNLQPGDPVNDDRGRRYFGKLNKRVAFDWDINLYDQTETVDTILLADPISYSISNNHQLGSSFNLLDTVQDVYLFKDTLINPVNPNFCLITNPTPPTNIQGCQSFENVQVCLGDTVQIGTQNPVGALNPQSYQYDWYYNNLYYDVLSDTTVRLPYWQSQPGMNSNTQFWYYLDTYDPLTLMTFRHCTSVTICPNCPNQISVQNNSPSLYTLELFPNPVQEKLNFVINGSNQPESEFVFYILDLTGRVLIEGKTGINETQTRSLNFLENGSYYLRIPTVGMKKFVVSR